MIKSKKDAVKETVSDADTVISDLDIVIYFKKENNIVSVLLGDDVKIVLDHLFQDHSEVALKVNWLSKDVTLYSK